MCNIVIRVLIIVMEKSTTPALTLVIQEGKYFIVNTVSAEKREIEDMSNGCRYAVKVCLTNGYSTDSMISIIDSIIESKLPVLSKESLDNEKKESGQREFNIIFAHMGNILKLLEMCSLKVVVEELSELIKKAGINLFDDLTEPKFIECPGCGKHGFLLYKKKEGGIGRENITNKMQGFMTTLKLFQEGHITRDQHKTLDTAINKATGIPHAYKGGPDPTICN